MNADLITLLIRMYAVVNESDEPDFNCQKINIDLHRSKAYSIIFMIALPFNGKCVLVLLCLMNDALILKWQCANANESDKLDFSCQKITIGLNTSKAYLIILRIELPFYVKYVLVLLWLINADLIRLLKWWCVVANKAEDLILTFKRSISISIHRRYIFYVALPFYGKYVLMLSWLVNAN